MVPWDNNVRQLLCTPVQCIAVLVHRVQSVQLESVHNRCITSVTSETILVLKNFYEQDKMSDNEGPIYKDGDIVWVKLEPYWWPGEVTEDGPEDFTSKKPTLTTVKFFNETTYEFVKSYDHIYYYNCDRKNEFIKKGMDSLRANNRHMQKFPGDVSLAEIRTDGNPNILSDPVFGPQMKSNVVAEVFGTANPPKKRNKGAKSARGCSSTSKNSSTKPKMTMTHRRFLGCDDYQAHIRIQYPDKERHENFNYCSTCPFETNRLDVMLLHVQGHMKSIASPVQVEKKNLKRKPYVVKRIPSDDDQPNSSARFINTDSDEEVKPKRKREPKPTTIEFEEEKAVTDIRSNLLAEWSKMIYFVVQQFPKLIKPLKYIKNLGIFKLPKNFVLE